MASSQVSRDARGQTSGSIVLLAAGAVLLLVVGIVIGRNLAGGSAPAPAVEPKPAPGASPGVRLSAAATPVATPSAPALEPRAPVAAPTPFASAPASPDSSAPSPRAGAPPVVFIPPLLDFGIVEPNTELKGTVEIRNVTPRPLKIAAMRADCKCTTVQDHTGRVIEPGGSLEFEAVVDGRSMAGSKKSQVRFVFEGFDEVFPVDILSVVSRAVRATPEFVNAVETMSGTFELYSLDERPFRVLSVNGGSVPYTDGFDPARDPSRGRYEIGWDLSRWDPVRCTDQQGSRMPTWWVVETDHPEAPLVDLRVRHNPCTLPEKPLAGRNWILSEQRVVLGELPVGEASEFTVELQWLRNAPPDDTIRRIEFKEEVYHATLLPVEREGDVITCTVRVTPNPEFRGLVYSDMIFHGYRAGHSARLTLIARVVDPRPTAG